MKELYAERKHTNQHGSEKMRVGRAIHNGKNIEQGITMRMERPAEKMAAIQSLINKAVEQIIKYEACGDLYHVSMCNVRRNALSEAMQIFSRIAKE